MKNQIFIKNPFVLSEPIPANLVILNLSRNYVQSLFSRTFTDEEYLDFSTFLLEKIFELTPDNTICCTIASDDKDSDTEIQKLFGTNFLQSQQKWNLSDELIWVKSKKNTVDEYIIDFEETPFSQIWILSKQKIIPSRIDFLKSVQLPDYQKDEILNSVWFDQPSDNSDSVPKEILTRIILSYSLPNDFVWDPLAGQCMTAQVCTFFNRDFLCFTNNEENLQIGTKILEKNNGNSKT